MPRGCNLRPSSARSPVVLLRFAAALLLALASASAAQDAETVAADSSAATTEEPVAGPPGAPARGTALRRAILDGLRAGLADVPGLERDVVFRVHKVAVLGDYALATVTPISPLGDPIYEYQKGRPCGEEIHTALEARTSGWRVVERVLGPCDDGWFAVFGESDAYPVDLLIYWDQLDAAY